MRAILLDYEARAAALAARPDEGHLREPVVRFVGLLRTLDAQPRNGRWRFFAPLDQAGRSTGQTPLRAPTVFNFFEPGYALPGEIAQAGLVSPEFQIATETTVVGAANLHARAARRRQGGPAHCSTWRRSSRRRRRPTRPCSTASTCCSSPARCPTRRAASCAPPSPILTFRRQADQRVLTLLWLASLAPESVVAEVGEMR